MAYKYSKGTFALDSIKSKDDSSVLDDKKLKFGTDGDVTFEYDEDGADVLQIAGGDVRFAHGASNKFQLRDGDIYLQSSADGQLDLVADSKVKLTAGTVEASADLKVGDDLSLTSDSAVMNFGADNDVTFTHDGSNGMDVAAAGAFDITAAAASTWKTTAGDLTVKSAADIVMQAQNGDVMFADGTTNYLKLAADSNDAVFQIQQDSKNFVFKQYDGNDVVKMKDNGDVDISSHNGSSKGLALGGTVVSATAAELNYLDNDGLSAARLGYLASVTAGTAAAGKALVLDADGKIATISQLTASFMSGVSAQFTNLTVASDTLTVGSTDISETEIAYIDSVTPGTVAASKAVVVDSNKDAASFRNLTATGAITAGSFVIGSADISEAELETIDGVTAGTVAASKAVVVDSNKDISGLRKVTATHSFIIGSAELVEADMEKIDGITDGTGAANKALVLDADRAIGNINMLTASYARIDELDVVTINSINQTEETLEISDKLIVSALSASSANSAGGGLRIGGGADSSGHAAILWDHGNTALDFVIGGTTEMRLQAGKLLPEANNDIDLGKSDLQFKDLYLDGVAYIDDLRADALGAALNCASQAMTNVNIDSGAIDGAVIGANSAAAGTFTSLVAGGNVDLGDATSDTITATGRFDSDLVPSTDSARALGSSALQWSAAHVDVGHIDQLGSALDANSQAITNINVDSGAIDGAVIGANSAAAAKFTGIAAKYSGSISANFTPSATADFFMGVDTSGGAVTITLPSAASAAAGKMYVVKDVGGKAGDAGKAIAVTGSADANTIDGASGALSIDSAYGAINLMSDGSNGWYVW